MTQNEAQQALEIMGWVLIGVFGVNAALVLVWGWRRLAGNKPTFAPTWSLVDVWTGAQMILALLVMLIGVMGLVLAGILIAFPRVTLTNDLMDLRLLLPATILQNVAFFVVPAGFIVFKYRQRLRDIGLPRLPPARAVWGGFLVGLLVIAVSFVLEIGLHALAERFRHVDWVASALRYEQNNPVAEIIRALPTKGPGILALAVLTIGIAAPFGEEMLFRGFLFNALKRRFGLVAGLVVSALLFASVHSYILGLLPVFLVGLVLAWVYQNSGSLWTSIVLHATNNTLAVLLAYFFPQTTR